MADDDQAQAQRNANLARIRDNQRRSRARRKEYLQELEAKFRLCEQSGVEATAEVQAAARKVIEENKRLRALLKQQGFSDTEIDTYLADRVENPQYPSAAASLESMLTQRRPCASASSSCASTASNDSSARPTGTASPLGTTMPPLLRQPPPPTAYPSYTSPLSSVSSGLPTSSASNFSAPQTRTLPSAQRYSMPIHPSIPPAPGDYGVGYEDLFSWQQHPFATAPSPTSHTSTAAEAMSSYAAADAIRALKPEQGSEYGRSGSGVGRDGKVSNSQIYGGMDRYMSDG